jgi:hypothetical protein
MIGRSVDSADGVSSRGTGSPDAPSSGALEAGAAGGGDTSCEAGALDRVATALSVAPPEVVLEAQPASSPATHKAAKAANKGTFILTPVNLIPVDTRGSHPQIATIADGDCTVTARRGCSRRLSQPRHHLHSRREPRAWRRQEAEPGRSSRQAVTICPCAHASRPTHRRSGQQGAERSRSWAILT